MGRTESYRLFFRNTLAEGKYLPQLDSDPKLLFELLASESVEPNLDEILDSWMRGVECSK